MNAGWLVWALAAAAVGATGAALAPGSRDRREGFAPHVIDPAVSDQAMQFLDRMVYKRVSSLTVQVYPEALRIRWSSTAGQGRLYLFVDDAWQRLYVDSGEVVREKLSAGTHTVVVAVYRDDKGDKPYDFKYWTGDVPCPRGHSPAGAGGACQASPCPPSDHRLQEMLPSGVCAPSRPVRCVPGWRPEGNDCVELECPDTPDNRKQRRTESGACSPSKDCTDGYIPVKGNAANGCVRYDEACAAVNNVAYERGTRPDELGLCVPADPPRCAGGFVPLDADITKGCVPFNYPCPPINNRAMKRLVFDSTLGSSGECAPEDPPRCAPGYEPLGGDISQGCVRTLFLSEMALDADASEDDARQIEKTPRQQP